MDFPKLRNFKLRIMMENSGISYVGRAERVCKSRFLFQDCRQERLNEGESLFFSRDIPTYSIGDIPLEQEEGNRYIYSAIGSIPACSILNSHIPSHWCCYSKISGEKFRKISNFLRIVEYLKLRPNSLSCQTTYRSF